MEASARASGERVLVDVSNLLALLNRQRCPSDGCVGTISTTKIQSGGLIWEVECACGTCKVHSTFLNIADGTFVAQYSPTKEEALGKRRATAVARRSAAGPAAIPPVAAAACGVHATAGGGGAASVE